MVYTVYLASLIVSLIVALALTGFFWYRRPAPGAEAAAGLMGAVAICMIAYIIEQLTFTLAERQIVHDILYIGLVSGPVFWFIFISSYVRYDSWLTRRFYLLWVIPVITLVLTWTNHLHSLIWYDAHLEAYGGLLIVDKTYGLWFAVHTIYSYSLAMAGIVLLALKAFSPLRFYRTQLLILIVSISIPLIWNIIYVFRAPPTYQIDLTPQAFIVSGVIMTLGLFRFKLLDILPLARGTLVERLTDGVMVLDKQNRIVDFNQAMQKITGCSASELIGHYPVILWNRQPELKRYFLNPEEIRTEMVWGNDTARYYELSIIPLHQKNKSLNGRLVILRDLTEHKKMEQALEGYARRVTLVQEEERQRVARELHDDTAQALAILSLEIDSLVDSKEIASSGIKAKLRRLRNDTDRAMQDVRRYSHELRPGVLDYLGLEAALEQLADELNSRHHLEVSFKAKGDECILSDDRELALFRIAQEAVNNSRKHSQASRAKIVLECLNNIIRLVITDNGKGFDLKQVESSIKGGHLGLIGMRERAQLIGASLKIDSTPGRGTTIVVELDTRFTQTKSPNSQQ